MPKKKPGPPVDPESKRSKGVDRHAQPRFAFHVEQEVLDALDVYCRRQKYPPDKSEVVRTILRDFLVAEGLLEATDADDDA